LPKNGVIETKLGARARLLEAAETCLLRDGYASLSTRAVAEAAQTQLSQIHYHFGSKQGLVLALLAQQNENLLRRQAAMFGQDAPLSARWLQACDFLEADLKSGYVRVLQEIVAAGYSDPDLATAAREALKGWFEILTQVCAEVAPSFGDWGELEPGEVATLAGLSFLGAETMILIDMDLPILSALRGVGRTLQALERRRAGNAG
jgi:AcrR family transcriptional regulator